MKEMDQPVVGQLSGLSLSKDGASPPCPSRALEEVATASVAEDSKPFFYPPLWLARRTAAMNVLRKENIRSVCDFGCGEGALLQVLSIPANHLDDFPSLYPPSPYATTPSSSPNNYHSVRSRKLDALRAVPRPPATDNQLHLRRLIGVDIDRDVLENAVRVTAPMDTNPTDGGSPKKWSVERERWEPMNSEIWQGGCEVYNNDIDGVEAITACEVIEHLTPAALAKFPGTILGKYSARIVVITTPNHEFNPWFKASSKEEEGDHRFLDPTGRTDRIFRDDDHRLEWTREEFQTWATKAAREHDYDVSFSGVGSLKSYYGKSPIPATPPSLHAHPALADYPIPSDPTCFYASQIAVFRQRFSGEVERSPRSHRTTPLPFFSPTFPAVNDLPAVPEADSVATSTARPSTLVQRQSHVNVPHVLIKAQQHNAHPSSGSTEPAPAILGELKRHFKEDLGRGKVLLRDCWNHEAIRLLCGGMIGAVVDAVVEDEEDEFDFEVDSDGERMGDMALSIVWRDWVEEERNSLEQKQDGSSEEEDVDEEEDARAHGAAFVGGDSDDEIDFGWEGARASDFGARIEG